MTLFSSTNITLIPIYNKFYSKFLSFNNINFEQSLLDFKIYSNIFTSFQAEIF